MEKIESKIGDAAVVDGNTQEASVDFAFGPLVLKCDAPDGWTITVARRIDADGAEIADIVAEAPEPLPPPRFTVSLSVPQSGMHYLWQPYAQDFSLQPNWATWATRWTTDVAHGLPLYALFDGSDTCRFSAALGESLRPVVASGGMHEEESLVDLAFEFFTVPEAPLDRYSTSIRIDARPTSLADAVRAASAWIAEAGGHVPCEVPAAAFEPLYSTWYCFHKDVFAKDIEEELAIAAKLGMSVAILDDGWHTDDIARDYARCGDWNVAPRRFPDMAEHVRRVHELGMKYMMWYSVPFVGLKSAAIERFRGKTLGERVGAAVLDPRFPEVRRFLVDVFTDAMREYGLDGLKLDFIDSFAVRGDDPAVTDGYAGRDVKSVPVAVDMLMTEIHDAIVAARPDALVEFRQSYVGAAIRQYGNMLRVGDCPGDMRRNRVAIAILRLTSGETAVHSDMLEWNLSIPAEEAALHVLNSIFGVVQYSVMLRKAPESHLKMIAHWVGFSRKHRNALLKGRFTPRHAELMFPEIEAEDETERIVGIYGDGRVADCGDLAKPTIVINATASRNVALRVGAPATATAFDTFGEKVGEFSVAPGLSEVSCPAAGYLKLSASR